MTGRQALLVIAAGSLIGCAQPVPSDVSVAPTASENVTAAPTVSGSPAPAPGATPAPAADRMALPNRGYTPGDVLTTDVATICTPGYTRTVRNVTVAEKRAADALYHWSYVPGAQEYDHLIPLELGGSNALTNLWPEPIASAHIKDRLENELHARVCSGQLTIQDAQSCIAVNWVTCWEREGRP